MADKVVRCKNLESIAFYGTNVESLAPFIEFVVTTNNAVKKIRIVWPFDDINRLDQQCKIAQNEESELMRFLEHSADDRLKESVR